MSGQRAVGSLAAAGTSTGNATVTIPLTAPGGTFYLLACADDTSLAQSRSLARVWRWKSARLPIRLTSPSLSSIGHRRQAGEK